MGFNDNSSQIFIDAVLTDLGREKLARNDGSFEIVQYRFGDDEIDYRNWNELTGSDSRDRKILDSPTLEASTNEANALRYPLITIRNSRLQFMPKFTSQPATVELKEQTDSTGGGVDVIVSQNIVREQTILPAEIIDVGYDIEIDNDLLYISGEIPVSITPNGLAKYTISATPNKTTAAGGSELSFNIRVQTLTTEVFDILVGANVAKPRTISANIVVVGQQSGMNIRIPTTITEFAVS